MVLRDDPARALRLIKMLPPHSRFKAQFTQKNRNAENSHEPEYWEELWGWDIHASLLAIAFQAETGHASPLLPGAERRPSRGSYLIPED